MTPEIHDFNVVLVGKPGPESQPVLSIALCVVLLRYKVSETMT
jgi:hypothetical protein